MKTFLDLEFKPHEIPKVLDLHATMKFGNGYGISVITGEAAYTDLEHPYEAAMINSDGHVVGEPRGHLTESDVTDFMKQIQEVE